MTHQLRQYAIVTGCYWAFTMTDGALRMLVVLFFHNLGYSPIEVASLFLLYEFFGVVTNLVGGWLAARVGLNVTMQIGLLLQIVSLSMLLIDPSLLTVAYVMLAQALSGIAKDLNKMSAKSSIKLLVPEEAEGMLYRWVSVLTGSKNTLKGVGFFLGAMLLSVIGFQWTVGAMALLLTLVLLISLGLLDKSMGTTNFKPKFTDVFSKSTAINRLSAARLFLFGSRDVWFVVALPVYLQTQLQWTHMQVGMLLALWIMGYGLVQTLAPGITGINNNRVPDGRTAFQWAVVLWVLPVLIAIAVWGGRSVEVMLVVGLLAFGAVFAVNSSIHSFLIVSYAKSDGVSLDVGFYYMANAAGRLFGTLLSGVVFQQFGLAACLLVSASFVIAASVVSLSLPKRSLEKCQGSL
ncbi:MFS transporter [Gammaproteobacteria bacterium 45_16_T64]|nr:MFS transporter [Gammaproteobacteria bacterium 45_16_T64]